MATEHFSDAELRCPCGKCDGGKMSAGFMVKLEKFRAIYGKPMTITSAFRCTEYNSLKDGKPGSLHPLGRAVDVLVPNDAERYQMVRIAMSIFGGVGFMVNALHVDDRDQARARAWTY